MEQVVMPWGTIEAPDHKPTTVRTYQERRARAALGEAAIALFGRMGVDETALAMVCSAQEPLVALAGLQEGV